MLAEVEISKFRPEYNFNAPTERIFHPQPLAIIITYCQKEKAMSQLLQSSELVTLKLKSPCLLKLCKNKFIDINHVWNKDFVKDNYWEHHPHPWRQLHIDHFHLRIISYDPTVKLVI